MPTRIIAIVLLALAMTSCQSLRPAGDSQGGGGGPPPLPPSLGRMQEVYPDLENGRFVCLADLNSMSQAGLFRTLEPDGAESSEQPEVTVRRSIDKTGPGGLRVLLSDDKQRLSFDGKRSTTLALLRDWSRYELLLFNICGPSDGVMLEFAVESGTDVPLRSSRRIFAKPGWRLYRFDLAELGDDIDLADVRAMTWRAVDLTAPTEIFLDDFLLTDNARWLHGENAAEGELYVKSVGRRLVVGVRDRFELAFSDGVIVEWRDDQGPNLTVRSGLGPWPVPLPSDWYARLANPVAYDDPALFADWGERAATRQSVVEQSDCRVIIEGMWRYLQDVDQNDADVTPETASGHTWTYVIYPTGQVYVNLKSQAAPNRWGGDLVGYAVALSGRLGFVRVPPTNLRPERNSTYILASQPGRERSDLLYCPHERVSAERQLEIVSVDQRRMAVTAGDAPASAPVEAAHMLRFWPRDVESPVEADLFAADYQQPATLDVARGRIVQDIPGDLDQDGFNESQGCYELALHNGVLRFRFQTDDLLRCPPLFRVHGAAGLRCWLYADGRIIDELGRDRDGNLLFRTPQIVRDSTVVEVNTREVAASLAGGDDR